jgi:hypothetical protein
VHVDLYKRRIKERALRRCFDADLTNKAFTPGDEFCGLALHGPSTSLSVRFRRAITAAPLRGFVDQASGVA